MEIKEIQEKIRQLQLLDENVIGLSITPDEVRLTHERFGLMDWTRHPWEVERMLEDAFDHIVADATDRGYVYYQSCDGRVKDLTQILWDYHRYIVEVRQYNDTPDGTVIEVALSRNGNTWQQTEITEDDIIRDWDKDPWYTAVEKALEEIYREVLEDESTGEPPEVEDPEVDESRDAW